MPVRIPVRVAALGGGAPGDATGGLPSHAKRLRQGEARAAAPAAPAAPKTRPPTRPRTDPKPETDAAPRLAPLYRVLIHNDEVTPMDFVVKVLRGIFKKSGPAAVRIMLKAHLTGIALVAVLPLEQAELRVDQAHSKARAAKYPLTFTHEPAE